MLTKKEKELQFKSFIDSNSFGMDTYITLSLCLVNVNFGVQTVDLYWSLINKINTVKTFDYPKHELHVKQHVALDMIVKIEIMVETLFVMIDALSKGYPHVSKQITRYDSKLPKQIIAKIHSKKYDLYKIIQLPKIQTLNLSSEESKFLQTVFDSTIDLVWSKLIKFANFYDKYYLVYLKTKHGLSIQTGAHFGNAKELDFDNSYLKALDHRQKNNMPKNSFTVKQISTINSWYDAVSMVKFNSKFKSELFSVASDIFQVMEFIVQSNLTYARNCGQGYLPIERISEKEFSLFILSDKTYSKSESEYMKKIAEKIMVSMNTDDLSISMVEQFEKKVQKSFKEDSVTTMHVDDKYRVTSFFV